MNDVLLQIGHDDFYDYANQKIFRAMVAIHESGKPIDDTLLINRIKVAGDWEAIGGAAYLHKVVNAVPNAAHAIHYAGIVREKSRLRKIIHACTHALSQAYDELPASDVEDGLEMSLAARRDDGTTARPIAEVWSQVIDRLQASVGKPEPPALLSGLECLDRIGLVFVGGEITILAARPGVGKTSLATQIAMHHSRKGRTVLFASLEMRDESLSSRPLMAEAGINYQSIRTRGVDQMTVDDLRNAKDAMGELPLYVWAPGRVKVGAIRSMAASVKQRHGLRLLIVDYTSWIIPDDPRAQRRDQVGEIVKGLRSIAQRLDVPVLLLHQLNREGAGEKPQLTHLRESGCVEEDADIVAFIHPVESTPPQALVIVAKSRQGAKGEVSLLWHAPATRFSEIDEMPVEDRGNYEAGFAEFNQREFAP